MSSLRKLAPSVYFVRRADGEGPVKIGCSQVPLERLNVFMCWAPYPLAIAATIPGDEKLERRFHTKFAEQHSHREWFFPSLALDAMIREIAAGSFDIDELPPIGRRLSGGMRRVDPLASQRAGFCAAVHRVFRKSAVQPNAEVEASLLALRSARGDERDGHIVRIRDFIRDPVRHGVVAPYPWCAKRHAEYLKARAA